MAVFKEITSQDVKTDRDVLEQLVDILQVDVSSSSTRRKYQVFVTGSAPGVTSSMFQTVFDQDFTLQTANPVFDVTLGLSKNSSLVGTGSLLYIDSTTGKHYFSSQSLMMREKMDIYNLHAQALLGNAATEFQLVSGSTTTNIREALFIDFKRLWHRDRIKRESFAVRLYQTSSFLSTTATAQKIYTDVGSNSNIEQSFGGQVSTIVDSANTSYPVGLLYLDRGVVVLDTQRVFDTATSLVGTIKAANSTGTTAFTGSFNKFIVSASMDDILDHICSTRVSSSTATSIAFQNQTYLNTTFFFCRMAADEFNYSANPTYTDSTGRIVVIDPGQEETQRTFSFVSAIGLYDAYDNLLAVGKLSRPVFKDNQRDFTVKLRLDYFSKSRFSCKTKA